MRLTFTFLFICCSQILVGQITAAQLLANTNFQWRVDSSSQKLLIYYTDDGWAANNIEKVSQRVLGHFNAVETFMRVVYPTKINCFIVDSREQMKMLIGRETNGAAFYENNVITGIATAGMNSIYSNHEFFHVVAMNTWGVPDVWINEGMAVYADNQWHGYDLYQLTHYLVDNNRYISLNKLMKHFKKADDLLSYPLMGSFVKYLDESYGRDKVILLWKGKKNVKKLTGKTIQEIEKDWLAKVRTINYAEIKY